ncbi:DUF3990 domain-containing protein [uncultured Parabacteroides sp.]|uniref:DUF3990 domain-containing protein n=1 Tax=uncultured Parabacteroides sp. TaxID=512312 RepID=UPI002616B180|nr:DUF3990 domain-containing protein [uncultured Parabacteroides sp.]
MILYHASSQIIEQPDILHSREHLDFGKGFYLTHLKGQAEKYAQRFIRRGQSAYIYEYELDIDLSAYKIKEFDCYDEAWLDYVSACRLGRVHENYDLISGGIADDKVFNTIDLYFAGVLNKEDTLSRLMYEKPNHQICILNQEIVSFLKLKSVVQIKKTGDGGK